MNNFKFVDFFAGIGGFHYGLANNGGECVLACEIDKYASLSYELLHGMKPVPDITQLKEEDVPDHDVLAAGFPCQAFSMAGKRLGFSDTRGTLFFEVARIAKHKQPKILFLENVKGLISHEKGQTLEVIVNTLWEIGYRTDFAVMNSKYFDVPQNRERWFCVAIREDLVEQEEWKLPKKKGMVERAKDGYMRKFPHAKTYNFDFPTNNTVTKKLKDVLEHTVDEKFYLSEEKVEKLILKKGTHQQGSKIYDETTEHTGTLLSQGGGLGGTAAGVYKEGEIQLVGEIDYTVHEQGRRVFGTDGVSPTVCARSDTHKLLEEPTIEVVGNSTPGGHNAGRIVSSEGLSPTLRADDGKGVKITEPKISVVGNTVPSGHEAGNVHDTEGLSPTVRENHGKVVQILEEPKDEIRCLNPRKEDGSQTYQQDRTYEESGIVPALCAGKADLNIAEKEYSILDPRAREIREKTDICPTICATDYKEPKIVRETIVKPLTERRTEEAKQLRKEHREKYGEDFSPRRGKEIVPREDEVTGTLTASPSIEQHLLEQDAIGRQTEYRVRKLTPRECLRLQSFPDEVYDILSSNGLSNSQIYKQAGNSVTVNVIDALAQRIQPYLEEK